MLGWIQHLSLGGKMKNSSLAFLVLCGVLMSAGLAEARDKKKGSAPAKRYEESSAVRSAGGGQRMAGCGLGSIAIEDNSKWAQVGAAFLNGTGMQTFGISFGTSNCVEDGVTASNREKDAFVEANYSDLRRDVVVGNGTYLSSLASFYGCQGDSVASFGRALQKNQDKVLGASAEDASQVIDQVVAFENASCQG